jgi:hypothetical protein
MNGSSILDLPFVHLTSTEYIRRNRESENFPEPSKISPRTTLLLPLEYTRPDVKDPKMCTRNHHTHYSTRNHATTTWAILPISLAVSRILRCAIPCLLGKQDLGLCQIPGNLDS